MEMDPDPDAGEGPALSPPRSVAGTDSSSESDADGDIETGSRSSLASISPTPPTPLPLPVPAKDTFLTEDWIGWKMPKIHHVADENGVIIKVVDSIFDDPETPPFHGFRPGPDQPEHDADPSPLREERQGEETSSSLHGFQGPDEPECNPDPSPPHEEDPTEENEESDEDVNDAVEVMDGLESEDCELIPISSVLISLKVSPQPGPSGISKGKKDELKPVAGEEEQVKEAAIVPPTGAGGGRHPKSRSRPAVAAKATALVEKPRTRSRARAETEVCRPRTRAAVAQEKGTSVVRKKYASGGVLKEIQNHVEKKAKKSSGHACNMCK